ncbi:hypothetical protein LPMP_271150 [Leishmania panamensis]|uniref:2-oxoglutarate-dependent dioxygenase, putative n=2 Tax=Leishmania guyanensis species complex TaxID=38579 RepID=A0A088RTL6_LEIPA|nr:hypothetical protein LPMP_271150 [Leishmania panamensis]AIN99497.1 hypothetical protein LPMP_271150 [Leishmania panamensis]CCM16655.1 hypothetical protein, conserved [Leishmania guyanensis]
MLELDGTTLTYEVFRAACLRPNRPAIIRNACRDASDGICFDLAALKRRLCPRELCRSLGSRALVPVYPVFSTVQVASYDSTPAARVERLHEPPTTVKDEEREEDEEGCCKEVPLEVVLRSWATSASAAACSLSQPHVYYLKDWHLQATLENTATTAITTASSTPSSQRSEYAKRRASGTHGDGLYRVPKFLGADWMDSFCSRNVMPSHDVHNRTSPADDTGTRAHMGFGDSESDYRFCYMGPVGSWTPLHCDVFGTYSWSFNVCGDKHWFFPTMAGNAYLHTHLLPLFPTPSDIRVLTGFELDTVVQHPGDLVFVPALFYHQVHNISGEVLPLFVDEGVATEEVRRRDGTVMSFASAEVNAQLSAALTVALNHNWCNAFNVGRMAAAFLADARQLSSHLSTDDLAVICDTHDPAVWRRFADRMLHNGTNWSFASMNCFLDYCLARLDLGADVTDGTEDERNAAADELRRLRVRVADEYARLFEE